MFNKNNKKIIFEEASLAAKYLLDKPKPAKNFIPSWFKKDKNYSHGDNNLVNMVKNNSVATYKMCVPVIDSMTIGYNITLPATIVVSNGEDKTTYAPKINWNVSWSVCDMQPLEALQNYPIPHGHSSDFFRWNVEWKIITPKDYSLLVMHPSHRYDLPFTTLSGIVDTDLHPNKLILPFFIKNGFEGIIEEGTPIAQIIPIKRDSWISETKDFNENYDWIARNILKTSFIRSYKKMFWSKKDYK